MSFKQRVEFFPSWNWIRPEPDKNYGITTTRIRFLLIGPKGAVQFVIGTMWGSESVRRHLARFPKNPYDDPRKPEAWDLGYHSFVPQYEGQEICQKECDALGGASCYYDGSTLNAKSLIEGFLARGTDWLWPKLEQYYNSVFEGGAYPDFSAEELPHPEDKA